MTTVKILHSKKQERFLREFSRIANVKRACEAAGIARQTHYDWLKDDPTYAQRFEAATMLTGSIVEEKAFELALEGENHVVLLALLKRLKPSEYRDRASFEHTGKDGAPISMSIETARALLHADE